MNHNMVAEVNNENTSNTDNTGYILHYFNEIFIALRDTIYQWSLYHVEIHHRSFDKTNYGYKT